ncbi:hypothetical protein BKA57DRAFT_151224 [Linnemannia elongata]|nr:hypothetical protein BKA57DRAFT_151224 [Linnemannia elongata]
MVFCCRFDVVAVVVVVVVAVMRVVLCVFVEEGRREGSIENKEKRRKEKRDGDPRQSRGGRGERRKGEGDQVQVESSRVERKWRDNNYFLASFCGVRCCP